MHFVLILLLSLITSPAVTHTLSLLDTLRQRADASMFADIIEDNPRISALYRSGSVKTVFAPLDGSFAQLRRREMVEETTVEYQSMEAKTSYRELNTAPGHVAVTNDRSGNLNGRGQAVVAHGTLRLLPRRYNANTTVEGVTISSGLGKNVSLIQGDIPYDGGIIHTVTGFFTRPTTLSATSNGTGNTQFASRLGQSNLTRLFDNTPSITCFLPSDAAFAAAGNITQTAGQIASQLSGHIVTDHVLYLPRLTDGATYKTKAGTTIRVSVQNGQYFINGALIVQSDIILENGVAHVINKVIPPASAPTVIPFTGSSSSSSTFNPTLLTILSIATAFLLYALS